MDRYATLDIGTNTVLLLVAERQGQDFVPVVERAEITRLGRGVDRTRTLSPVAMDETVATVARFAAEARALGAKAIACVATSASRDALNGAAFLARLRAEAGIDPQTIDGEEEAALAYAAVAAEVATPGPLVALDIGGGSTEFVFGKGGPIQYRKSLDLGSVRLTERFVANDPPLPAERAAMARAIDEALVHIPRPDPDFTLVGIAGTVTTLAAVAGGVEPYDTSRVHLARLSRETVERETDRLFTLDLAARRGLPGMHPKRADVIAAGALLLARAMMRLEAETLVVSDRGVRWGLLRQRFGG